MDGRYASPNLKFFVTSHRGLPGSGGGGGRDVRVRGTEGTENEKKNTEKYLKSPAHTSRTPLVAKVQNKKENIKRKEKR